MMKKLMAVGMCVLMLSAGSMAYAENVYVTQNGTKYHKADCRFIKNRETEAISRQAAEEKGLKPCSRCFKEELSQLSQPSSQKQDK